MRRMILKRKLKSSLQFFTGAKVRINLIIWCT